MGLMLTLSTHLEIATGGTRIKKILIIDNKSFSTKKFFSTKLFFRSILLFDEKFFDVKVHEKIAKNSEFY